MPSSPFAKAIAPLIAGLISVLAQWMASGEFNASEFTTALTALITALLVYYVPNKA